MSSLRFDCYPSADVDETKCKSRGCCWIPATDGDTKTGPGLRTGMPFCFYPVGYQSYSVQNRTKNRNGSTVLLKRIRGSGYPDDVDLVRVDVTFMRKRTIRVKVIRLHCHLSALEYFHWYLRFLYSITLMLCEVLLGSVIRRISFQLIRL